MKKILATIVVLGLSLTVTAQSEKYTEAMTANLALYDSAKTADDFLSVSAAFERIANTEKTQWLPYYYASLAHVMYGMAKRAADENDAIADKAEQILQKAESLQKDNSEIVLVRSLITTLHMLASPMQRYMEYSPQIEALIEKSKQLDPDNPRPYYIHAMNLRNVPEQFGGGCGVAKPLTEESIKKFGSFKPASGLHPNWGLKSAKVLLASCQ
ncbi:MAG: hypothetical protein J7621_20485 [Niastella sp.]|nr:hypothetical protein [Niastella sp.]